MGSRKEAPLARRTGSGIARLAPLAAAAFLAVWAGRAEAYTPGSGTVFSGNFNATLQDEQAATACSDASLADGRNAFYLVK